MWDENFLPIPKLGASYILEKHHIRDLRIDSDIFEVLFSVPPVWSLPNATADLPEFASLHTLLSNVRSDVRTEHNH